MNVDTLDLFYQHRVDPFVPIRDVAGAVKQLIQAGKVRQFGLSGTGVKTIRPGHAMQPVAALQSEYSLWRQEPGARIIPTLEEPGTGFDPFSLLGQGFLTGKADESTIFDCSNFRNTIPSFSPEIRNAFQAVVDLLGSLARRKNATPAQTALA